MDDFHCSFCGKRRREVVKLISGPRVFICNECVALCLSYIEKDKQKGPGSDDAEAEIPNKLGCSFCGRSQDEDEVERLIAGPTVNICNSCLDICVDIIEEEKAQGPKPSG